MNINYDLLKIFYVVAINQSISRAAALLKVSQPAVSQSIQNLEKSLAGQLFIRSKKGVSLTEEGKVLYTYVEEGMTLIDNGLNKFQDLRNLNSGKIKVGATSTLAKHVMMPYLKEYHAKYPEIEVDLVYDQSPSLLKQLKLGNLDAVILSVPKKEIIDINITSFMDIQDVFIANNEYYNKSKELSSIFDLLKLPVIVEKNPSISRAYFDLLLKSKNIECSPSMEVENQDILIDLVSNGFGIGFATKEYIQTELEKNKIFIIDVGQIPKRRVGIATMKKGSLSLSIQKFVDLVTNNKD